MFKICIAVLLQIIQFSTDENTLEVMRALEPGQDRMASPVRQEGSASKVPGLEPEEAGCTMTGTWAFPGEICEIDPGTIYTEGSGKNVAIAL